MKKIVLKGAEIGAFVGYVSAILYPVMMINFALVQSFSLPKSIPDMPKFSEIFLFFLVLLFVLCFVFLLAIPSGLIGLLTGTVFGLIYAKFHVRKNIYVIICAVLCASIALLLNLWAWDKYYFEIDTTSAAYAKEIYSFTLGVLRFVFLVPGILYSIIGLFTSIYMFNTFEIIELEHQVSLEDAISTSA